MDNMTEEFSSNVHAATSALSSSQKTTKGKGADPNKSTLTKKAVGPLARKANSLAASSTASHKRSLDEDSEVQVFFFFFPFKRPREQEN